MRISGVDRPWWWSPRSPWLTTGFPTLLLITNFVRWYDDRSTFHLIGWIVFLITTVAAVASALATRRRLQWESLEF